MGKSTIDARTLIKGALLDLMAEKPFERISIADIIRRAGVSRTTYYYHYYEQVEVIDDIADELVGRLLGFEPWSEAGTVGHFELIAQNAGPLSLLLGSTVEGRLRDKLAQAFMKDEADWAGIWEDESDRDLVAHYLFEGYYGIVRHWVIGGCAQPPADVARLMLELGRRTLS